MTVLVTAALVRLLSLLSPLCPPVLSSFDFSVSEMNELRKYWDCYLLRTRLQARDVVHDWIEPVADFQPVESGWRRRTRLFHQQRRRFGSKGFHQQRQRFSSNGHFLFDP
ncbi:hypothetical protein POPTR_014G064950v4 [Populus trichocarpa]|uniref:Uncharacterized protein n=2 Tax=Populus trichocarpa TaxID=3694 RepID=A0ACC0RZG0_POPTR|nr:hypothetical protein POPTR_014G064950v4 [Populus trichocarpa]